MVRITPKNWKEFQHYGNRRPPWIKLHRSLLDDFAFSCLPIASKALAPCLWLLASEREDAVIEATIDEIAFRVRMNVSDVKSGLKSLIEKGFFLDASNTLADCKQDASLEIEIEREKDINKYIPSRSPSLAEFDRFWEAYPKKVNKGAAQKAWRSAIKKAGAEEIIAAVKRYGWPDDKQFIPHPASWLNGERWADEGAQPKGGFAISEEEFEAFERERQEWLRNLAMKTSG